MKQKDTFKQVVFILLLASISLACSAGALAATVTPVPTNTVTLVPSTNTATPKPTSTPLPTATEIPPTPVPVPMGTPVSSRDYEVNVIYMRTLNTVYLDTIYQWVPTQGNMFVELGIKVVNLEPSSKVSIPWSAVYIIEENGDMRYPSWGEFKPVKIGIEFNPKELVFRELKNPAEQVSFDEVVYLRAIYGAKKLSPTTLLFGFGESPLIKVIVP